MANRNAPSQDQQAADNHIQLIQTRYFPHRDHRQRAPAAVQRTRKIPRPFISATGDPKPPQKLIVQLVEADTLGAARTLYKEYPNDKIAILNHANARVAGGGFRLGSHAQEEDLCHCTTLYATLGRHLYPIADDELIYSPDVLVVKERTAAGIQGNPLPDDQWYYVDVISSAAISRPPLINNPVAMVDRYRYDTDRQMMRDKIVWILNAAADNKVKRLVIGAFGCGVFRNPPREVAQMMKDILVGSDDLHPPDTDWGTQGLLQVVIAIFDPMNLQPILNHFKRVWREPVVHDGAGGLPQPIKLQYDTFPPGYVGVDYTVSAQNPPDANATHDGQADGNTTHGGPAGGDTTHSGPADGNTTVGGQTTGSPGDSTMLIQQNMLANPVPDDSFADNTLFN